MALSVAELITAVKRRASVPENQDRFVDADFVGLAQEELNQTIFPMILSLMEEFFIVKHTVAMKAGDTYLYPSLTIPIPNRAYARSLREIRYVDTDGTTLENLPQLALDDLDITQRSRIGRGFYMLNDSIRLHGDVENYSGSLELHFVLKPSTLVTTDSKAAVQNLAYATGTTTFSVASVSADMSTYCALTAGTNQAPFVTKLFDVYRSSTGAIIAIDIPMTRISTLTFTTTALSEDTTTELKNYQQGGYLVAAPYTEELYIVPAGICPNTPIPPEVDNALVLAVCGRVLEGLGDTEGLSVNDNRLANTKSTLTSTMGNRVAGEARIITNRRGIRSAFRNF